MSELAEIIPSNMAVITKVELDSAIATAKAYPRDIRNFLTEAKSIVACSEKIAASCMYTLKRKGYNKETRREEETIIKGGSIRLAEIIYSSYGNLKAATRIVNNDGKMIKVEAVVIDLQKNNTFSAEQARSILKSDGKTYSNDMQVLTMNAASAIAFRNAIFKSVPKALIDEVYEEAEKVVAGDDKTLPERRKKMIEAFAELNVPIEKVLKYIKKKAIEEITVKDIPVLVGIYNAVKDNAFEEEEPKQSKSKTLNEELKDQGTTENKDNWDAEYDKAKTL
jgi:hypothetical protein